MAEAGNIEKEFEKLRQDLDSRPFSIGHILFPSFGPTVLTGCAQRGSKACPTGEDDPQQRTASGSSDQWGGSAASSNG